jgi:hypothetical protein
VALIEGKMTEWSNDPLLDGSLDPATTGAGLFRETLIERQQCYRQFNEHSNEKGDVLTTVLRISSSHGNDTLCTLIGRTHWIIVGTRLIDFIDALFSAVSGEIPDYVSSAGSLFGPQMGLLLPSATGDKSHHASHMALLVSGFMAHVALRFVCDHEFYHAISGHAALIRELFDSPLSLEIARNASPYERSIRLAMEMESDRSAFAQHVLDVLVGDAASNRALDNLVVEVRVAIVTIAIAIMMAAWAAHEKPEDMSAGVHPIAGTRIFTLVGPTLSNVLSVAGLKETQISAVHVLVGTWFRVMAARSRRLGLLSRVFGEEEAYHAAECRRIELSYELLVAQKLKTLRFANSGSIHINKP